MKLDELLERLTTLEPERKRCIKYDCITKTKLVNDISKVFKSPLYLYPSIEEIKLRIFIYKPMLEAGEKLVREYVAIKYRNGSTAATNNNMNSVTATYRAIGDILDGGEDYGDCVECKRLLEDPDWEEVEVDDI